jgi:hypothetical protein
MMKNIAFCLMALVAVSAYGVQAARMADMLRDGECFTYDPHHAAE